MNRHLVVAITGASGGIYGLRLVEELLRSGLRVSLLISRCGFAVLREECGIDWAGTGDVGRAVREYFASDRLAWYAEDDFFAPIASGSAAPDAMVVCPCSMGSLARIAAGISGNLLERTADVQIKEGRPLVLVPRETPLSAIHLENMLKLARIGVKIVPAMPAFYQRPQSIKDQVDFVVGKVLDQVGVEHALFTRWGA
jgi:4-hydroxy-3-polyprenylbenzoate decarboxylase